jgi:hypothetical protein
MGLWKNLPLRENSHHNYFAKKQNDLTFIKKICKKTPAMIYTTTTLPGAVRKGTQLDPPGTVAHACSPR